MKDNCIISFASYGRENYNRALLNLIESIKQNWDGDTMLYSYDGKKEEYLGIPIILCNKQTPQPAAWVSQHHWDVPFQFKVALFQIAREKGYKKVLWCDSTMLLNKNPMPLFAESESGVIAFHNLGHPLIHYISDKALQALQITEEQLTGIEQIMACVVGFDFDSPYANDVFDEWVERAKDGSFIDTGSKREEFKSHRHDQAVLSGILWKHGIPLLPYGKLIYAPHDQVTFDKDVYFVNQWRPEYNLYWVHLRT